LKNLKINKFTGLPASFDDFSLFSSEEKIKNIIIKQVKRKKFITILQEVVSDENAVLLKKKLGCNGFRDEGRLCLQGDHKVKIRNVLRELNLADENLIIKHASK